MLRYLPVSPLYYVKPYTKAVGVGLSPYPYAEGVTSLLQKAMHAPGGRRNLRADSVIREAKRKTEYGSPDASWRRINRTKKPILTAERKRKEQSKRKRLPSFPGGNPIGDRLWMEHYALQLFRGGALDEAQYKKLLARIDRELAMRYKAGR